MTASMSRTQRRKGMAQAQRIAELEHDLDEVETATADEFASLRADIAGARADVQGMRKSLNTFALSIAGSALTIAITVTLAFGK